MVWFCLLKIKAKAIIEPLEEKNNMPCHKGGREKSGPVEEGHKIKNAPPQKRLRRGVEGLDHCLMTMVDTKVAPS